LEERNEYSALLDDFMHASLHLDSVEVKHRLDSVEVFADHLNDLLEIIRLIHRRFEFTPGHGNHICFEIRPKAIDHQIHLPSCRTESLVERLYIIFL